MKALPTVLALACGAGLPATWADEKGDWIGNTGAYLGLEAGVNLLSGQRLHENHDPDEITNTDFHKGFIVGIVGGYGFDNGLRPELEISRRRNAIERTVSTDPKDVNTGFENNDSGLANLWYDIPIRGMTRLHPYVGGGVGASRVDSRTEGGEGPGHFDTVLAWQGGAGVAFDVAPHITLSADWRYLHTKYAEIEREFDEPEERGHALYIANTAMLTARYVFGLKYARSAEPAPVAPPPSPVAEPPPPPVENVVVQTINFQFDATVLTPAARQTLDDVARALRDHPSVHLRIEGNTDSIGSEQYNQALSERRAKAVRDYLVDQGVQASQLDTIGLGESHPIDDNGTPEGRAANRRADFTAPENESDEIRIRIEGPTQESKQQAQQPARGHRPDPGIRKKR